MELINWSLSAIDKIFSLRKGAPGEPACPDGTLAAGYSRDAWHNWQLLCLEALAVEDVEDIYLFGFMIAGFLIVGFGIFLIYYKICKTAGSKYTQELSSEIKGHDDHVSGQFKGLHQVVVQTEKKTDYIAGQTGELLRMVTRVTMRLDEMSKELHELVPIRRWVPGPIGP